MNGASDFSRRASAPEKIDDRAGLRRAEVAQILAELELVNRWLGGINAVLEPVKVISSNLAAAGQPVRLIDFGAGSGDVCKAFLGWASRQNIDAEALAVDFNQTVCSVARGHIRPDLHIICGDVLRPPFDKGSADIIVCSAFLHHFSNEEIVAILSSFKCMARFAVVSDLQRSRLAWYGIRLLTALFSKSRPVRHDGPLSVRKGFRKSELRRLFQRADYPDGKIEWCWAFRYRAVFELAGRPLVRV